MSRDYGRVRTLFWESETTRELAPEVKFVALYLLTSPHTNAIGCFRLPPAYVAHDTGMSEEALKVAFDALQAVGFISVCERAPWIYLPKYLRHNPPENPNVWRKCVKELASLPAELSARSLIGAELYGIATDEERMRKLDPEEISRLKQYVNGSDTVSQGITPYPLPVPKPEPEPNRTDPSISSLRSDLSAGADAASKPIDPVATSKPEDSFEIPAFLRRGPASQESPKLELVPLEGKSADPFDEAISAYNAIAKQHDWPVCQVLNEVRKRSLRKRLTECGGIEGWQTAMAKAEASGHLTGRTQRSKGFENWRPDIDFFLQAKSFTKLMEGGYDDRTGAQVRHDGFDAVVEGARRAAARD